MGVRREHHRFSKRITRTKRWQVLRAEILERDGYRCCSCGSRGRLEVDHVKPVRTHPDLSYDPGNLQALCPGCHTRKTRIECGHKPARPELKAWSMAVAELENPTMQQNRWSIPFGLAPSRVPVMLVCGPPGAGKTTYAKETADPEDIVIDFDDFLKAVSGGKWESDPIKVKAAFRLRDDALHSLRDRRRGKAWFVVTAPEAAERKEWARHLLRTQIVMLAVDAETCKARIRADPDRQHAIQPMCAGVDHWWRIFAAEGGATSDTKKERECWNQ